MFIAMSDSGCSCAVRVIRNKVPLNAVSCISFMLFFFFLFSDQGAFCSGGHELSRTSVKALNDRKRSPYSSGARCDVCCNAISMGEELYHCDKCKYDVCMKCISKIRMKCPFCTDEDHFFVNLDPDKGRCSMCKGFVLDSSSFLLSCPKCFFTVCRTCHNMLVVRNRTEQLMDSISWDGHFHSDYHVIFVDCFDREMALFKTSRLLQKSSNNVNVKLKSTKDRENIQNMQ